MGAMVSKPATIDGELVTFYELNFAFQSPDQMKANIFDRVGEVVRILQDDTEMSRLSDPSIDAATLSLDGLSQAEISQAMQSLKSLPEAEF